MESRRPVGTSPIDPLRPTTPHADAGIRMDPPVSVPIDARPMPDATATPDPPLEPPADRAKVARIAHGPERAVFRRGAERELVQVRLADENRSGGFQARR
jgi:hypothetical protein